jgi:hypothetical protein
LIVFFTDRDLGHSFPALLREAGIATEHHDAHFGPNTSDEEWLQVAASQGWYVLTHNQRIRYTPNERDLVMSAGVGLFVLVGATSTRLLAENFLRTRKKVESFIQRTSRPFIARVYRASPTGAAPARGSGRVELWLSEEDWLRARR